MLPIRGRWIAPPCSSKRSASYGESEGQARRGHGLASGPTGPGRSLASLESLPTVGVYCPLRRKSPTAHDDLAYKLLILKQINDTPPAWLLLFLATGIASVQTPIIMRQLQASAILALVLCAMGAQAEVVTYQKCDGKGSVSETDDTTLLISVPDTTWIDDGRDVTHFEIDLSIERRITDRNSYLAGHGVSCRLVG
jgi:hypothetical protein